MHSRNLDEAIEAVTKVYCPHTVEVVGPPPEIDAVLEIDHPTSQPLVTLSYSAPVKINAPNFSRLFLMMRCSSGAAATLQERRSAEWHKGQTMPFSAGFNTQLWFDRSFVQRSVRLDTDKLELNARGGWAVRSTSRCGLPCALSRRSWSTCGAGPCPISGRARNAVYR